MALLRRLSDLRADVRSNLGESSPSFWTNDELDRHIINFIRELQSNEVPDDALAGLLTVRTGTINSTDPHLIDLYEELLPGASSTFLMNRFVSLHITESDGDYGLAWNLKGYDFLQRIRALEGDYDMDSSRRRYVCIRQTKTGGDAYPSAGATGSTERYNELECYANPVAGRTWKLRYIKFATEDEEGDNTEMDLPFTNPDLQTLVVYGATAVAAAKKNRYIDTSREFRRLYEQGKAALVAQTGRRKIKKARIGYL